MTATSEPRRALVTGAASGLGAALTAALLERGDEVLATDLATPEDAAPGGPHWLRLDVRSDDDWEAARAWVEEHWGRIDLLVNNAGIAGGGRIDVCTMAEWERLTEINLFGVVRGTRAFTPMFKRQGDGVIVNVASLAGLAHPPGMAAYNAVKAAVVAFSETVAHELSPYGVQCSVVCPSYFRTNLMSSIEGADADVAEKVGQMVADSPLTAEEIAASVLRAVDQGVELIIPDGPARAAYQLKRTDRSAYDTEMRRTAARLKARADAGHDTNPAGKVRDEDAFDADAVARWLREHADDPTGLEGTPEVHQFAGGASNLTYLLRYPERVLILRRPPRGAKAKSAHDMGREFTIQSRLKPVFEYVPGMVAFCDDQTVIGSDFYVMERVDGTILRADLPDGLSLSEAEARALCTSFLDVLVELHGVDVEAAGLDDLGKGAGYVGRQVAGWSDRFRRARTDNVGDFEPVMAWLDDRQPDDVATCVIHNDFRLDNVVLDRVSDDDPLQVRGVLDWEMATLGDPLMDLGGAMAYWIQADDDEHFRQFRRQPSDLPGMLTRWEMVSLLRRAHRPHGHPATVDVLRGLRAVPVGGDRPADLLPLPPGADDEQGVRRVPAGGPLPRATVCPADRGSRRMSQLLLVRHGQASWGAADYDVLSEVGELQAQTLGRSLSSRGLVPDVVLHGAMKRQRETARLLVEAAGWGIDAELDDDWDEMNHHEVLERQPRTFHGDLPSPREFQAWFEAATHRWTAGENDHEYEESFPAFGDRVLGALGRVADRLPDSGVAVVVTSGGPIARVVTELLAGGTDQHRLLAPVIVNTSVTKLVVGSRGTTLVSFNEHGHLESTPDLVTYR